MIVNPDVDMGVGRIFSWGH